MSAPLTRIVVGYDGSPASLDALHWATAEAVRLRAPLRIVEAFDPAIATRPSSGKVVPLAADHPDVPWETCLITGQAARAILQAAESADLVVVGSRGHGGFTGLLLGSVSQSVLHHTPRPIAIVR